MPFDPNLPADHSPDSSAEMRAQLTGLRELIAGLETRVAALEAGPPPGKAVLTIAQTATDLVLTMTSTAGSVFNVYQQAPGSSPSQIGTQVGSPFSVAVPGVAGDYIYTAAAVSGGVESPMSDPVVVTVP